MTPGTLYWFTGLAGAGKTTLATEFAARLRARGRPVILFDGDELRRVFGNDLGYTREERLASAMRNARVCKLVADQGIDVVCATISLFHACRAWNRDHFSSYREVYVTAPPDVLAARHPAKLYGGGEDPAPANVVGVDVPAELPTNPDVIVENDGRRTPAAIVDQICFTLGLEKDQRS